ncbi:hypothetical protein PFISCL1PPCAC_16478, partial [Pristionchus fissidentatus]
HSSIRLTEARLNRRFRSRISSVSELRGADSCSPSECAPNCMVTSMKVVDLPLFSLNSITDVLRCERSKCDCEIASSSEENTRSLQRSLIPRCLTISGRISGGSDAISNFASFSSVDMAKMEDTERTG